ncbi:MAG: RidA family protein [Chthoniobacterales bacterium]|nr:RidA family protein [Chthoniobacterales bacterium]
MSTFSLHADKTPIHTNAAPQPIGSYSQAIKAGKTIYFSGQIGIDPQTGELVEGGMEAQLKQVFNNMQAVAQAAGASLDDIVKLTIFTTDLSQFPLVNEAMKNYFHEPYPARSTVQVTALPKGALIEIEGVIEVALLK